MEETPGVVGSAETGSPSQGTLASLREASTSLFQLTFKQIRGIDIHEILGGKAGELGGMP